MKKTWRLGVGSGQATALEELDRLEAEISAACRRARRMGRPGLAHLRRALQSTRRLRAQLSSRPSNKVDWGRVVAAAVSLVEFARMVCNIFICIYTQRVAYGHWVSNKAIAYGGGQVADRLCPGARCHAVIPFAGGKRPQAA